jgi:hypothetical protein
MASGFIAIASSFPARQFNAVAFVGGIHKDDCGDTSKDLQTVIGYNISIV